MCGKWHANVATSTITIICSSIYFKGFNSLYPSFKDHIYFPETIYGNIYFLFNSEFFQKNYTRNELF